MAKPIEVLSFSGVVGDLEVHELQKRFGELAGEGRFRVIANLANVKSITEAAMGFFIRAARVHRALSGDVVISAPSDAVSALDRQYRIARKLRIFATDAEAARYLEHGGADGAAVPAPVRPRPSLSARAVPPR